MKKTITFFRLLPVILLALLLTGSGVEAWGQTQIFSVNGGGTLPTGWTATNNVNTNVIDKTSYYLLDAGNPSDILTTSNYDLSTYTVAEFKVNITSFDAGTHNPLKVEVSYNGGTSYTQTATTAITTGSYVTQTISLNSTSSQVKLRLSVGATSGRGIRLQNLILNATSTATPDIALANNGTQVAAADVSQGTAAVVLHKFQLGVTSASASLTGMTCTTTGTYAAADITNLKVRYSADATLDGADATLSTFTNPGAAGSKTFPSFTSRSIASGTTGYVFITADVAANATHNNTIAVDAITTDNLTFSSGNKTGSTTAGGAQTFKDVTAPIVTTYSPADGNTAVTVNQNLVLTFSEAVKAGTAGDIVIYNSAGAFETIPYNDSRITFSSNTVTINPTGTFAYGANYYVQIAGTAITDNVGNAYAGIANNTNWNFTTVAPSVTNVTSSNADGTYKVGDVITVTVTFNENVVVTGTPYVLLKMVGTNRQAAYASGTGTNTLTFSYTLQTSDEATDLDYFATTSLSGGTITSTDGVAVTRTLASPGTAGSLGYNKAIVVDCVKPTVSTYNPNDGNTAVTINQNLVLTLNENVKRGASGSIVIYTTGPTVFETIPYDDSRITFATNTVTINPEGTFAYSSDYYVQTTGNPISDMYDNNYAGISDATTWNFTTECGPVTLPYSQDFTTYLPNTCWTEKTGLLEAPSTLTGTSSAWSADGFANNGSTGSAGINIFGTAKKEWLITPTIDLGSSTDYQLEFDLALTTYNATTNPGTTGTDDKFAVVISTDNGATWTSANTLRIWKNSGSTDVYNSLTPAGTHVTISLADYTGLVKIGFYGESTVSNADNDLFIDNLSVVQLATCITPTVVTSSDVTAISATISWVASSSNPANGYQYELRTSGAAGSGATGLVTSGTTAAGVVSKAITDLVPNTAYNVFVRSDCGAGDYSAWTSVYSFSTPNLAAPTATVATAISTTGFTANWGAVASATGYELDVYQGGVMLNENFNTQSGTGGNDGLWSGTIASATISGLSTWTLANAYGANYCIKLGTSSAKGIATTPALGFTGNAKLSFRAGAWNSTSESTTLTLEITGGGTLGNTSVTLVKGQFSNYEVTITGATASSKISFSGQKASDSRFFLDDVVVSNKTSVSGSPFTVTETTKAVTGLTANSAYYYAVVAKNGGATSASSNVITAFTAIDGAVSASAMPNCPTCDVTVATGGTLTLNASKIYNSVTVAPGAKLTLQNGFSLSAPITLQSNASGTATFVDKREDAEPSDIIATVQQHLPAASTRTWWYLASPVSGAASTVFGSNKVGDYSETTRSYSNPFAAPTTLTAGKGYVVKMTAESAANYIFANKILNTGDISIGVTRTVTETTDNAKRGFNLVGNPYPSYLNWEMVYAASTNIRSTIWYRTLDKGSMAFYTYNAKSNISVPDSAHGYIPPMQAFWVKVDKDPTEGSVSNGTLNFTNDMRSHDLSALGNPLKTTAADRNLVRLSISNGTLSDETVIVTHPSASDNYDSYDSEKMANGDTNRPEIFSMAGNQELVINGISPLTDSKQIALGVRPGRAGNYTISLTEWRNTGNMEAVLRDNQLGEELILTESNNYSFSIGENANTTRFSLLFRAKGSNTGFDRISSDLMIYSTQNTIRVESASLEGNNISIFNALGQPVFNSKAQSNRLEINGLTPAVYMVKVNNQTKMVIVK